MLIIEKRKNLATLVLFRVYLMCLEKLRFLFMCMLRYLTE